MRKVSQSRNFAAMRTDDLLSVSQVAEVLNLPPRTVHHRIKTGKIAAVKVGTGKTSAYVITRQEVDRLLSDAA